MGTILPAKCPEELRETGNIGNLSLAIGFFDHFPAFFFFGAGIFIYFPKWEKRWLIFFLERKKPPVWATKCPGRVLWNVVNIL